MWTPVIWVLWRRKAKHRCRIVLSWSHICASRECERHLHFVGVACARVSATKGWAAQSRRRQLALFFSGAAAALLSAVCAARCLPATRGQSVQFVINSQPGSPRLAHKRAQPCSPSRHSQSSPCSFSSSVSTEITIRAVCCTLPRRVRIFFSSLS